MLTIGSLNAGIWRWWVAQGREGERKDGLSALTTDMKKIGLKRKMRRIGHYGVV